MGNQAAIMNMLMYLFGRSSSIRRQRGPQVDRAASTQRADDVGRMCAWRKALFELSTAPCSRDTKCKLACACRKRGSPRLYI
mmetsp:Transcript_5720/g.10220  ORF Transcript_5720/g.10220 Transcript_5720/m.10220 type:complete len:82 (+) Transcript_5720:209-454(+)